MTEWIKIELPRAAVTVYLNGLLYYDPTRGRLYNLWLRWSWSFRHWRATRNARGAS